MYFDTLCSQRQRLASGETSSEELTRSYLERIAALDEQLNCFISVCPERALEQSRAADRRLRAGDAPPLCGLPVAHKDIFCTRGVRTTCASKMLADYVSPFDATVVERCEAAGMVMLGKTNLDEFAMGSSCEYSYFGPTRNPWAVDCVPGGSSGGSAAAVAAGLCPAATGTDTGGSIRQPAALCGVTGLKPTYGLVSRYGMVAFASSLDQAGTLTRTAEDAALLLSVMAGRDRRDSTCIGGDRVDYLQQLATASQPLTIGVVKEWQGQQDILDRTVENAVREFTRQGHKVTEVSLPNAASGLSVYYILAPAECASNLARFDGVRYGYCSPDANSLQEQIERSRSEGFGEEVQRRIMVGTFVLSHGYYDAYYHRAQCVRRLILQDFEAAFANVDVLLGPTTAGTCFPLGECRDDPVRMYWQDYYTIPASLAGLPALSIPAAMSEGKPLAVQLIGPVLSESRLLSLAHGFQQQTDWHLQHPDGFSPADR